MVTKMILSDSAKKTSFTCPEMFLDVLKKLRYEWQEHFVVIPLDSNSKPLGVEIISIGLENCVSVESRTIFKRIFTQTKYLTAVNFIAAHNHPSGDETASLEDIDLTKDIIAAGKVLNFQLADHLIISKNGLHSIRRHHPEFFKD